MITTSINFALPLASTCCSSLSRRSFELRKSGTCKEEAPALVDQIKVCRSTLALLPLYSSYLHPEASTKIMESGRGSCRLPRTLGTQSCSLKGALVVFILTIHIQWAACERNEAVISASRENHVPWNKTSYKTVGKCRGFHPADAASYFFYWPEDDRRFEFCCATNGSSYDGYTYGRTGPTLYFLRYYDLGLIDKCLPYWRCLNLFEEMMKHRLFIINCEFTDLRGLYKRRFINDTVLKRGLLQSGIPFILVAEIAVIAFVAVYWLIRRRCMDGSKNIIMRKATKAWQLAVRKRVFKDWTHLCLLAIIGNGLIEAVGRQASVGPQSKAFYNYGRLYLALSILVWYSSVLHQISIYIAELEFAFAEARLSDQSSLEAGSSWAKISRQTSESVELEDETGLGKDWEWQPIGAQAGILFCLWGFLTYAQDDATTGAVFGIIVSAAAPWSGLYASKGIVHTFPWIVVKVYQNLFKARNAGASQESYRAAWTSGIKLPSGGSPVHPNDSHGTSPV